MSRTWSTTQLIAISLACLLLGSVIGGLVIGYSKFSKGIDVMVDVKDKADAVEERYGSQLQETADGVFDKSTEAVGSVGADELGREITEVGKDVIREGGETAKSFLKSWQDKAKQDSTDSN